MKRLLHLLLDEDTRGVTVEVCGERDGAGLAVTSEFVGLDAEEALGKLGAALDSERGAARA